MKVSGTSHLSADRDTVWRALNDPAVLVRTIPGCQRLQALGGDAYAMTLAAGVGAIKGVYDGQVRLTDQEQPGSFRMHAQGAGAPGTIGADVLVTLTDRAGGGTELTYDADAVVGGMIGGVGQRMLTGVSKRMAEEFFRNVDAALAASAEVSGTGALSGGPHPSATPGFVPPAPAFGLPPDPTTGAPTSSVRPPAAPTTASSADAPPASVPRGPAPGPAPVPAPPGTVFAVPEVAAPSSAGPGFAVGVAVGAAAALAGAVVGGWLAGRRRG